MRFLHLGIHFKSGKVKATELQPYFDANCTDWLRYSGNCWVLYTNKSADVLTDGLRKLLDPSDEFVFLEVKINTHWGINQQWIWDWMAGKGRTR